MQHMCFMLLIFRIYQSKLSKLRVEEIKIICKIFLGVSGLKVDFKFTVLKFWFKYFKTSFLAIIRFKNIF